MFAKIFERSFVGEHGVDDAGELVGGHLDGHGGTMFGIDPTVVGTKGGLAVVETPCSEAIGLCGPIGGGFLHGGQSSATGDLVAGTQTQP